MDWLLDPGPRKIYAVKAIRLALGVSLGEAKALADSLPQGPPVYLGDPMDPKALEDLVRAEAVVVSTRTPTLYDHILEEN